MKMRLNLMLLLFGISIFTFTGCRKPESHDITIRATNLSALKPGVFTGNFTAVGAINTSGTGLMIVVPVGEDSIHCTYTLTAPDGTFAMAMDCEAPPMMSGAWKITGGTDRYRGLFGGGTLMMMFPPDIPAGEISEETMTGEVWLPKW
jgi:hypothetical protein